MVARKINRSMTPATLRQYFFYIIEVFATRSLYEKMLVDIPISISTPKNRSQ